jgi:hypothetical protein
MLISADFIEDFKLRCVAQHPPASHDEFIARRHAERAPRVSSFETKLTSSLDDYECDSSFVHIPNDDSSSVASTSSSTTPPTAPHDEYLARRHAQRAPRVSSLEAKLTSSFLVSDLQVDDNCECVIPTPHDDTSSVASSVPTCRSSMIQNVSRRVQSVDTRARVGASFRRTCSV